MRAKAAGGTFTTKPVVFAGHELVLNYATSAAGRLRVEITDLSGARLPGFELDNCPILFGDSIAEAVTWSGDPNLSALAGKPVRLKFELRDADLYAFQFQP